MTAARSISTYFRTVSGEVHGGGRRSASKRRTLAPADLNAWNERGESSRAQYHGDGPMQRRAVQGASAWLTVRQERAS